MAAVAALVRALVDLAWAIIAAGALIIFRKDIASILKRLRKGKVSRDAGIEVELDALESSASAASEAVLDLPPSEAQTSRSEQDEEPEQGVLQHAVESPKIALVMLAAQIERQLRELDAARGRTHTRHYTVLAGGLGWLGLPRHMEPALDRFRKVRNQLVHGGSAHPDDIARALDSGLRILDALRAIPREINVVYHPGVEVYADAECKRQRTGVKAVILETSRPDSAEKTCRVFPTTRDHFRKGELVAWEWCPEHVFPESWYRDPDSGEVKYGWTQAAEFVGRHLDGSDGPVAGASSS